MTPIIQIYIRDGRYQKYVGYWILIPSLYNYCINPTVGIYSIASIHHNTDNPDTVCPEITLITGDSYTLGPCRTVQDIKVYTSLRFPEFFPPEVIVLDENAAKLVNKRPAPGRVSVILLAKDRNQRFWELSFEAFSFFGDLERASRCLEEVEKHEPRYKSRKCAESAKMGET